MEFAEITKNPGETSAVAARVCASMRPQKTAAILALKGDLGSGKTTFVQALAKTLGVQETVTSPTFVIEKIYKIIHPHFEHLIHIDAYRIEKSDELVRLGWKEILGNPKNIIALEWPERVRDIIPAHALEILFEFVDEHTRKITSHA